MTSAAVASAQTIINSVPYTISASGEYVLGGNLNNASGGTPAITINAPNVILDLNGFYLSGANAPATNVPVIFVGDVANVTIRNGLISNESQGIRFNVGGSNARNYIVENMIISRCSTLGIFFSGNAPGSIVRNNTLSNLGSTSSYGPIGIRGGGGIRYENNSIANITTASGSQSIGISAADTDFSIGNTISNCTVGIEYGKYLNNLTSGCSIPFQYGTNATGNN